MFAVGFSFNFGLVILENPGIDPQNYGGSLLCMSKHVSMCIAISADISLIVSLNESYEYSAGCTLSPSGFGKILE